jgi:hypothetical protein
MAGALGGDEPQHVRCDNLMWLLGNPPEEHPQVIGGGQHGVRPAPPSKELQIAIGQRHPQPHHPLAGGAPKTDQARIEHRHFEASSFTGKQPPRLVEMSWKITGITSMRVRFVSGQWTRTIAGTAPSTVTR